MNHQPHHIDEIAERHPAGDRLEEGTGQRKRARNAFGRTNEEAPAPGSFEESEEQIAQRIRRAVGGNHRTVNAFGRPIREAVAEAAHRTRNAFGRLLEPDEED